MWESLSEDDKINISIAYDLSDGNLDESMLAITEEEREVLKHVYPVSAKTMTSHSKETGIEHTLTKEQELSAKRQKKSDPLFESRTPMEMYQERTSALKSELEIIAEVHSNMANGGVVVKDGRVGVSYHPLHLQ